MTERDYISVSDVMVGELQSIDRMASVQDAIRQMRDLKVTSLVVERRDHADEFGLITTDDIAREVIANGRATERRLGL